ncbi:hypothetical protein [Paenibacillus humicola]|nr:hypothetical protein [Paenibacillus humicola]
MDKGHHIPEINKWKIGVKSIIACLYKNILTMVYWIAEQEYEQMFKIIG